MTLPRRMRAQRLACIRSAPNLNVSPHRMRQWRHRSELRGGCLPPYLCLPFGVKIVAWCGGGGGGGAGAGAGAGGCFSDPVKRALLSAMLSCCLDRMRNVRLSRDGRGRARFSLKLVSVTWRCSRSEALASIDDTSVCLREVAGTWTWNRLHDSCGVSSG
jgi:hypothetical protein